MENENRITETPVKKKRKYKWWKLFIIGFTTYMLGLFVLIITENSNLFPSVVMLGNFLIPVTYVAFFYEKRHVSNVTMTNTVASFFYGGFLGTFAAAVLEPIFIHSLNFQTAMIVGLIEEFAKIIGVLMILRPKRHHLALDGIIIGASAGMGFAALESSGYAFTTFIREGGSISAAVFITMLRGILSPLGHGTWTAILGGVLMRESGKKYFNINWNVIKIFITVVLLHGLWDGIPDVMSAFVSSDKAILAGEIVVGFLGVFILLRLWREAHADACRITGVDEAK